MAYPSGFSREVLTALTQLLTSIPSGTAAVLLEKHLGHRPSGSSPIELLWALEAADRDAIRRLLVEVFARSTRADANPKYVYEERADDLRRWLFHDGWQVEERQLVAVAAAVEETTELRDYLLEHLGNSGLDPQGAIRRYLEESAAAFRADPPDVAASTTKVRVAMETIAREGVKGVAARARVPAPNDTWGAALAFLRGQQVITSDEEQAMVASYRLISPGAHVPKGLTDVEWARFARTAALANAYFLLRVLDPHR